ncbi:MAG: GDSL family lipase [Clostridiaceae bacterium]|jgi:lysophospholipase L1-like esterase|nr:GDSL family lipase [Clostridiaceae bacterium]
MYKTKLKAIKTLFSIGLITAILGGMFTVSKGSTQTIKIMPVGDSCTEGMGDPDWGSYRTDLYKYYTQAGLSVDFVGSNKRGPSSLPDRDNEGHSGWTIPQVAASIDNWLNTHNPDVVLLWIGGNDMFQQGRENSAGLSNLIDQIINNKPNITIFVADYYPWPEMVKQYNAKIPGVVQQKASEGKKVYFVKLSDVQFSQHVDLSSDGLHLNTTGYSKIAKLWYDNTISILRGLGNTPVPTPTPTPTSNLIKGDVNGDREVNSLDFGYLRKYLLGIDSLPFAEAYITADMNNDGEVNSLDFGSLRLKLLGLQ